MLFAESKTVQCRNCHKVGDVGKAIGPDLNGIGKKLDKPKLLESILDPSKRSILNSCATRRDEQRPGRYRVAREPKRQASGAGGIDGKETTIATKGRRVDRPQQKSLMPELLLQDMTAEQVADLLEYFGQLK